MVYRVFFYRGYAYLRIIEDERDNIRSIEIGVRSDLYKIRDMQEASDSALISTEYKI